MNMPGLLVQRSVFESELSDHIPVVKTSVAGTRLVGRMTVGMCTAWRLRCVHAQLCQQATAMACSSPTPPQTKVWHGCLHAAS